MASRRTARERIREALSFLGLSHRHNVLAPRDAYRLWSASYDAQPDNVVLQLEAAMFGDLMSGVSIEGKTVLDVGCGTGRHWARLLAGSPAALIGADSSPDMLDRLRAKYPAASLHALDGTDLVGIADRSIDVLVSTLMIGHIRDVERALAGWSRALKDGGHIILTDFHPEAFRAGMTRTFLHQGVTLEVENHLHSVGSLRKTFRDLGLVVAALRERRIDDEVRALFERQGNLAAYARFEGTPMIIGFHLAKPVGDGGSPSGPNRRDSRVRSSVSGAERVSLCVANCDLDWTLEDPNELLDRYHSLVGWADALAGTEEVAVTVVQRFRRDALIERGRVTYQFVDDGRRGDAGSWFRGVRLARAVVAAAPDVVHVNGCTFPLFVRNLRGRLPARVAIVVQDHGGSGIQDLAGGLRGLLWKRFHRLGLRAADSFLFTAREQAAPWHDARIIGREQVVHEVPEASTDLAPPQNGAATIRRLPGRPALLSVARLDPNKDPLTLLAGFERAARALPDAALTLVFGDDVMLPQVRARIASSTVLASRVHLLGRVGRSELSSIYQGADLFLLASHREVASFALIEALSLGLTPIVSDIPPFRALTDDGRLGALFRPGDPGALARAIEHLGRDDLARRRVSVQAHFALNLSWSAVARKALVAYRETARIRRSLDSTP